MEHITLTEASRRYHISERTLRKWIRHQDLPAQEVMIERRKYWQIEVDELERVIEAKHAVTVQEHRLDTESPTPGGDRAPIGGIGSQPDRATESAASQEHATRSEDGPTKPVTPIQTLPDGWIVTRTFADEHKVLIRDVQEALSQRKIKAERGEWRDGKTALTPEQQRMFCDYFINERKMRRCDDPGCVCNRMGPTP